MNKKFYIACSLRRWPEHNALRDCLHAAGHEITHDWTDESPWVKELSHGIGGDDAKAEIDAIRVAARLDLEGIKAADVVIVLLPGGDGTHAELGAASVLGIPVVLHGTDEAIWNTQNGYTCAFYHTGLVFQCNQEWNAFLAGVPTLVSALSRPQLRPGLDAMAAAAYDNARLHGFWGDPDDPDEGNIGERLMLIITELAEAFEDYRDGVSLTEVLTNVDGKPGKPGGFPVEMADVIIRIGDLCGRYGIPLDLPLLMKMAYNESRPWKHGGKKC